MIICSSNSATVMSLHNILMVFSLFSQPDENNGNVNIAKVIIRVLIRVSDDNESCEVYFEPPFITLYRYKMAHARSFIS